MSESEPRPGDHTRTVHGPGHTRTGAMSAPVVHSATFSFDTLGDLMREQERGPKGAYYQRLGHPTLRAAEERLAYLEGAEQALLFPSGMAAISAAFLSQLAAGGPVGAPPPKHGGARGPPERGGRRFGWGGDIRGGGPPP